MVRTVIGRVNRPINSATGLIQSTPSELASDRLSSVLTLTRASDGTYVDPYGTHQTAGANVPRITNSQYVATNLIYNPRGVGGQIGPLVSGGAAFPTGWGLGSAGLHRQILALDTDSDNPSITVRFTGVATANNIRIHFSGIAEHLIPVPNNADVTGSIYLQEIAGDVPPAQLRILNPDEVGMSFEVDGTWTRYSRTRNIPATNDGHVAVRFGLTVGAEYDFTLRYGSPQFEISPTLSELALPPVGQIRQTKKFVGRRLLMEEPRTNLFPAPIFSAIAAGTTTVVADPNGGTDGRDYIPNTTLGSHYLDRGIAVTAGSTQTLSVYLKRGTSRYAYVRVYGTGNAGFAVVFTLEGAGSMNAPVFTAEYTSGGGTFVGSTIKNMGGGWYRCSITGMPDTAATTNLCRLQTMDDTQATTYAGDGVNAVLTYAWPQLETAHHPSSYIPTPTAATTRIHDYLSADLAPWYKQGPQITNMLLHSSAFSEGIWIGGASIITSNTTTAPDNTTTADTLTSTAASLDAAYQIVTVEPGKDYVFSFYVKLGTMSAAEYRYAIRDDSNGVFIAADVTVAGINTATWTRVEHKVTAPAGCTSLRLYIYRATVTAGLTAFVWGAQLEQASSMGPYVGTTTAVATETSPGEGTVFMEAMFYSQLPSMQGLVQIDNGGGGRRFVVRLQSNSANILYAHVVGNTTLSMTIGPVPIGSMFKLAFTWGMGENRIVIDGGAHNMAANVINLPTNLSKIHVGAESSTGARMNGEIGQVRYYPYRMTSAQLVQLTA